MTVFRVPDIPCPTCAEKINAHGVVGTDTRGPRDGDLTLCLYCLSYLTFTDGAKSLRLVTDEEFAGLDATTRNDLTDVRNFYREHGPGTRH